VRGRPLHELVLYGPGKATLSAEQFGQAVVACEGEVFVDEERYLSHLSARLFGSADKRAVVTLAERLREVRNPTLLGDVSPQAAAAALRESLPGVAEEVITATADALAESDATRDAFDRDRLAASVLTEFRDAWCAHATEAVKTLHAAATDAAKELKLQAARIRKLASELDDAVAEANSAYADVERMDQEITTLTGELVALKEHQHYKDAGRLQELKKLAGSQKQSAGTAIEMMKATAAASAAATRSVRDEIDGLSEDVLENQRNARTADPEADDGSPLLTFVLRPRSPLRAGGIVVEPGPELAIVGDAEGLRAAATTWQNRADDHQRRAEGAGLAVLDHKQAEALQVETDGKRRESRDADSKADGAAVAAKQADIVALEAARELSSAIAAWSKAHETLMMEPTRDQSHPETRWTVEDVPLLAGSDVASILEAADSVARDVLTRAEEMSADLRAQARSFEQEAVEQAELARKRREDASELRAGRLLPLPRPEWAGEGDDAVALGSVIDWRDDFRDPRGIASRRCERWNSTDHRAGRVVRCRCSSRTRRRR
jgi:hypothetical protein